MEIGLKYYKYIDDKLDIIRIHKIENDFIVISRGINKTKVSKDYLNDYIRLNPDGCIFFNIVNMGRTKEEGQDVMVLLFRKKDLDDKIKIPYAACRQNIYDPYTNSINRTNNIYLGCSMNQNNIPEGIDFKSMLACYGLDYSEKINIYIDDSLDIILSMISDINRYNKVLFSMYKIMKDSNYIGLCKNIKDLLQYNHFYYDFLNSFNIHLVDFIIKYDENNELLPEQRRQLEDLLKIEMFKTYVFKYSKHINLNKVERDYILVMDKIDKLYIIAYDKGEYLNRAYKDNIKDKRDAVMMLKHIRK